MSEKKIAIIPGIIEITVTDSTSTTKFSLEDRVVAVYYKNIEELSLRDVPNEEEAGKIVKKLLTDTTASILLDLIETGDFQY